VLIIKDVVMKNQIQIASEVKNSSRTCTLAHETRIIRQGLAMFVMTIANHGGAMEDTISKNERNPKSKMNRGNILAFFCAILFIALVSCNSYISGEKVNVDDATKIYTYKETGELITGTVVFYELDPKTGKKYKARVREVHNGKRINKGYDYYPNGLISAEFQYDENGFITGTVSRYYETGQLLGTVEYKEDKPNGITKAFDENGVQILEAIFENGTVIKEYEFENGKKIIPAIEKLELIELKTGYRTYLYSLDIHPMVHTRWKNISDALLSEIIEITAVFIDNKTGQELGQTSRFLQGSQEVPLQTGLWREVNLTSQYTTRWGRMRDNELDIYCHIYINKQLYGTLKIENKDILH